MIDSTTFEIVDTHSILNKDLPLIVLADDLRSFLGWGIKAHTSGQYSHIMAMVEPGMFASQGWVFDSIPMEK